MVTKRDVADLDPGAAQRLIKAVKPITFERIVEPGEGAVADPPPFRRVGFAVEDIEGAGVDGLIRPGGQSAEQPGVDTDPDQRGYSLPGLLACAISVMKQQDDQIAALTARIEALEA